MGEYASIEFSCWMHFLFISRLVNRNARIWRGEDCCMNAEDGSTITCINAEAELPRLEAAMRYFDTWRDWCKSRQEEDLEKRGASKREGLRPSSIAAKSLKTCIYGFLHYAKLALALDGSLHWAPIFFWGKLA